MKCQGSRYLLHKLVQMIAISETQCVPLSVDLANALHYIHESEKMLHNDIKGNNVTLESEAVGHLKAIQSKELSTEM